MCASIWCLGGLISGRSSVESLFGVRWEECVSEMRFEKGESSLFSSGKGRTFLYLFICPRVVSYATGKNVEGVGREDYLSELCLKFGSEFGILY